MKRIADIAAALVLAAATAANVAVVSRPAASSEPAAEAAERQDTVLRATLVFAGDMMLHKPQLTRARTAGGGYDFRPAFRHVADRFRRADYAVLNLETTLAESGHTGYPCFRSPVEIACALADMGIDAVVTANNHCCDGGSRGVATTVAVLDSLGIRHTGAFADSTDYAANHPIRFECSGISFAMFSHTYGTNGLPVPQGRLVNRLDTIAMARDLAAVDRDSVDVVIDFVHWGNEYERRENAAQRRMAGFLRRHGVDLVIGSHPHVVQPFEADSAHVVLYSLGNFVSNQQWRYSDGGLIARIDVTKRAGCRPEYSLTLEPVWVKTPEYEIIPPEVGDTLPMSAEQRRRYGEFLSDTRELLGL